jgi:hypothetical protein
MKMNSVNHILAETGMPGRGACVSRPDKSEKHWTGDKSVGALLENPEMQSGAWLIDGGWGAPPGPVCVEWKDGRWVGRGYWAMLSTTDQEALT